MADNQADLSPYLTLKRSEWARQRGDTPMTLTEDDVIRLGGLTEELSVKEVEEIYLPLSRLLNLYVGASQNLHAVTSKFLGQKNGKMPFILGIAGSVACGKSTTARVMQALLARWPNSPKVALISTDGFLRPNKILKERGLMEKKGFPESFNSKALLKALSKIKAGKNKVSVPVYSHHVYDIVPGKKNIIDRPDILIVEGLNVLQPARLPKHGKAIPFVSDFFDFSIYIDAKTAHIEEWYVTRFKRLCETHFKDPDSYFHRYSELKLDEIDPTGRKIWKDINEKNLVKNILPTRQRADLIIHKSETHAVDYVKLRKL